tara:strand:+ start:310 stop:1239 length:930 start_codon:yes stop_codon:yes gene_type:complete
MRVLVTGGSGFLGKHVIERLVELSYTDVIAPNSKEYNLLRYYECSQLFATNSPDVVIHLAATCGGIGANKENPGKYFYNNIMMGINVIEAARLSGVSKFIMVGTVCSYPKYCKTPFKEEDIWSGYPEETNAPYGIAKKSLYTMLQAYYQQYNFNSSVFILSNLYGQYDNFKEESSHVIPSLILKFDKAIQNDHEDVEIWGTGTPSRDFLHAKDASRALCSSIGIDSSPSPINIGTGKEILIDTLARKIQKIMGHKGDIVYNHAYPDGQPRRSLDVSKAKKMFNFQSEIGLDSGLEQTISWYKDNKCINV